MPRASSVFPAPRGPPRAITSPGRAAAPRRAPWARVAAGERLVRRTAAGGAVTARAYPKRTGPTARLLRVLRRLAREVR